MESHDQSHLLLCGKEDLVEYIMKLKKDISLMKKGIWIGSDSRKTTLGKLDEEIEELKEGIQNIIDVKDEEIKSLHDKLVVVKKQNEELKDKVDTLEQQTEGFRVEYPKLKKENEELRKRDEEAMKLTMAQNERFMNQLEEQEQIKEKLADKINILKNGPPDKYKVGDMLKCYRDSHDDLGMKFLKIVGLTKTQYKVREIINEHNRVYHGQDWTDYYKVPKDTSLWKYKSHKNITKKRSLKYGITDIKEDTYGLDSDTHYVIKTEHYCN